MSARVWDAASLARLTRSASALHLALDATEALNAAPHENDDHRLSALRIVRDRLERHIGAALQRKRIAERDAPATAAATEQADS
jgi:hypothetical protein